MIDQIVLNTEVPKSNYEVSVDRKPNTISISLNRMEEDSRCKELGIIIKFLKPIIACRSHKYTWETKINNGIIMNSHSPKVLVLQNNIHVVSSTNEGCWCIKDKFTLEWVLSSPLLTPLFQYNSDGSRSFEDSFQANSYDLQLIMTKDPVPEISRSKLPFTPILTFTDHCDFDTSISLKKQLDFFNEHGVKVSKGFFLNHYSKRPDNASYENDKELIDAFAQDHEVFYHALTQSLRTKEDAIKEFADFDPPEHLGIETYVDHGYQIYNLTKRINSGLSNAQWAEHMHSKGIKNLWTYVDSGTSESGIVNQLNRDHFSLARLLEKHKFNLKLIIRTLMFYSGNEELLLTYRRFAGDAKLFLKKRSIKNFLVLLKYSFIIVRFVLKNLLFHRNRTFKYANYTPFIFRNRIGDKVFNCFQTVEVTNFEDTFSKENIDLLIEEKGALIAHCYFSSPLKHQQGKLFQNDNITERNQQNFEYLKEKLIAKEIWNPSISELIAYSNEIDKINFVWNEESNSIMIPTTPLHIRTITYV